MVGEKLAAKWSDFAALSPDERSARVVPYAQKALAWFVAQAGSMGMTLLNFLLTVIIAAILYAQGEVVKEGILSFARRLAGSQGEEVAILAAKSVRGVMLGVVVNGAHPGGSEWYRVVHHRSSGGGIADGGCVHALPGPDRAGPGPGPGDHLALLVRPAGMGNGADSLFRLLLSLLIISSARS